MENRCFFLCLDRNVLQSDRMGPPEDRGGRGSSDAGGAKVALPALVCNSTETGEETTDLQAESRKPVESRTARKQGGTIDPFIR